MRNKLRERSIKNCEELANDALLDGKMCCIAIVYRESSMREVKRGVDIGVHIGFGDGWEKGHIWLYGDVTLLDLGVRLCQMDKRLDKYVWT